MGYKSTLLSTLIPIRYGTTIDTLADIEKSGLPLVIPKSTAVHHAIASDKRPIMKQIFVDSILYRYAGQQSKQKYYKMYGNGPNLAQNLTHISNLLFQGKRKPGNLFST